MSRKKAPPAPGRTDLYVKISEFLRLPRDELSKLADLQRQAELKKKMAEPPRPLFKECRDLILRKCDPGTRNEIARIFGQQPFGELERLVTQRLLDVAQGVAREELRNEVWLRRMARLSNRSYEQIRVAILEFLDTDVFNVSVENCVSFLDPMIDSWDIDLKTFGLEIVLNGRLAPGRVKRFEFVEKEPEEGPAVEPGLEQFLKDTSLSGDIQEEEIDLLKRLKFRGRRPSPLYYYRELQSLRDPLHFPAGHAKKSE
ncbi:MAG TPA: XRE family transcriptional regulator [Bryobacteraceae bacterium]|nr:XRE family transcriptional regulator [Bryobacteraceae bacterium]